MPVSLAHEARTLLIRNNPSLVAHFCELLGVKTPEGCTPFLGSDESNELKPVELTRDRTVIFRNSEGEPEFAVCFEVQLRKDESRRFAWPMYVVRLFHDLRCPVVMLVLTTSERVRQWCAAGLAIGHPGFVLRPLVVTSEHIERVTTMSGALRNVELAVLSAITHGDKSGETAILDAVFEALNTLDPVTGAQYSEFVTALLTGPARAHAEHIMATKDFRFTSEYSKRLGAQYKAEGLAEGLAEGEARGKAESVLRVLRRRGLHVSGEVRDRVLECTDLETLDRWFDAAFEAGSAEDVFRA
ncbi:hypothetical protein GCM10022221_03560 [Actinocorallia aurea]